MAFSRDEQGLVWFFSVDSYRLYHFREIFSSIWIHQKFGQGRLVLVYITLFQFIFTEQVSKCLKIIWFYALVI